MTFRMPAHYARRLFASTGRARRIPGHAYALLFAACSLIPSASCRAQEEMLPDNRYTTHTTMIGAGHTNLYETYLSPFNYKGPNVSLLYETMRKTRWKEGRITTQTIVDGYFCYTANDADNANELGGKLNYYVGWYYNWTIGGKLRLAAGGGPHLGAGAFYNVRNIYNPVQAKADFDIDASVMAVYPFRIKKANLTARYQASMPLLGIMFSPNYQQSYYEMSLGNYDHNICFTYPGNMPSMRHFLTLDFPIKKLTFRVGYLCDIRQSKVNGLRSHVWNHTFMIGYVRHLCIIRHKDVQSKKFIQ